MPINRPTCLQTGRVFVVINMYHGSFATTLEMLNNRGDVTVQKAGDAWSDLTNFDIVQGDHGNGRESVLTRRNGMYENGRLRVIVFPDGFVSKDCSNPNGTTDFCAMAVNAGYVCQGTPCP